MMLSLLIAAVLSVPVSSRVVLLQGHTTCGTLAANDVCVGGAFQVAGTHDGVNTTTYALYKNGVQVATAPVTARVGGEILFTQTLTPAGTYTYRINAIGPDGATASPDLTVVAKANLTPPAPFTLLRIIRINP